MWLLVAGGATFAAFPEWYATLFSGFYLPLLLILVALIVRGVAFEYRAKRDDDHVAGAAGTSRSSSARSCRRCCGASPSPTSCAACRSTRDKEYVGSFFNLLNPYALLGGADHAAAVPHPRRGVPRAEDRRPDPRRGAGALASQVGAGGRRRGRCCSWAGPSSTPAPWPPAVAFVARRGRAARPPCVAIRAGREGWAFLGTSVAIALAVAGLFLGAVPGRDADHARPTASSLTDDQRLAPRTTR